MPGFPSERSVVPVVRMNDRGRALEAVMLLHAAGMESFEITLTTPGAVELIAELKRRSLNCIGAGTVLSREDAARCIEGGADFIVSPALRPAIAALCMERAVPCCLGAATPSEILAAHEAGAELVKVFPAAQLGGPAYIRAVKSVFPQIPLMPTGGIAARDIAAYFAAGAGWLGMGGGLVAEAALIEGRADDLRAAAEEVRAVLAVLAAV